MDYFGKTKLITGNTIKEFVDASIDRVLTGAMLTGNKILEEVNNKSIVISDFDEKRINPNSYNLRIHPQLKVYKRGFFARLFGLKPLDLHKKNETKEITIPENGLLLKPNRLYIGRTIERTFTDKYIPMINGRSSTGRCGLSIHITAGFGDIGFDGTWTLEITVVEPLIIYPNDEICQLCWFVPHGSTGMLYKGRYQGQVDATESRFHLPKTN